MKARLLGLTLAAGLASSAAAHHAGEVVSASDLQVSHAWTFEVAAMAHAVDVYLTIDNEGDAPDRLIAASVDFAAEVEIQAPVVEDGVLKTATVQAVEIAPGQTLTFQPGGVHLVLQSVQRTFEHGQHFDLLLTFERAGAIEVEVEIEEPGHEDDHEEGHEPAA
jgi:periplasmic copper chaperone A